MNTNRSIRFACLIAAAIAAHPAIAQGPDADRGGQGENCSNPIFISSLPFSASGDTTGFSNEFNVVTCSSGGWSSNSPDVVYLFQAPYDMAVEISMCRATAYDSFLHVYTGSCASLFFVTCNDDDCGLVARIPELWLTGGSTYRIVVDGFDGNSFGAYTLDIVELHGAPDLRCDGSSAFANEASPPDGLGAAWEFAPSDIDSGAIRYESFALAAPLTVLSHLTFWGATMQSSGFTACTHERPVRFNVQFFSDAAGLPGTLLYAYDDVLIYPTAVSAMPYFFFLTSVAALRFDLDLTALPGGPCLLPDTGWVTIHSFGGDPNCHFSWLSSGSDSDGSGESLLQTSSGFSTAPFDLSLCLQGAPPFTCAGDADGNGVVNTDDITFVILRLGNVCP